MYWITSDLHLGHKAILKMLNRPFENVEEMNETLIKNFNSRVCKHDKVIIVGDCTHHLTEEEARNILSRLNGRKHLIVGNHDKLVKAGGVFESVEMLKSINDYGKTFWLCHYPLMTWNKMRSGAIMLHGHMHNQKEYNIENKRKHILRYDVGVDANNYFPVSTKEILEFFGEEALNNPFNNHHEKSIIEKIKYFFIKKV